MKKLIIVLIFMAVISPVFAQPISEENSSNMYYINVRVEKVYPSGRGYVIQYLKSTGDIGTVGIPNDWFTDAQSTPNVGTAAVGVHYTAAGKGEILTLPPGKNWPSMSVFYADGKFSHVRLYVHRFKGHQTWGNIPQGMDVSRFFSDDRDSFTIQY